jgi:general stress protein YciG
MGKMRPTPPSRKHLRGFGSKSAEEVRAAGAKGGRASQAGKGAAQRWTKEQARAAGAKGGRARWNGSKKP